MSESQNFNDSTDIIIITINEEKPKTTSQLVSLIQKKTNMSGNEIIKVLIQLEAQGKIHFKAKSETSTYLFSFGSAWYWAIVAISLVTAFTVFTFPEGWYPLFYVRNVLGIVFVLFLPGYSFVRAIFQKKVPIKTSSESFDNIERLVLSIAMSIALTPMVGLILYYTPIGIGLAPIYLSLLALTLLFATIAMAREYNTTISA